MDTIFKFTVVERRDGGTVEWRYETLQEAFFRLGKIEGLRASRFEETHLHVHEGDHSLPSAVSFIYTGAKEKHPVDALTRAVAWVRAS